MTRLCGFFLALCLLLCATAVTAAELITNFDQAIGLHRDGSMRVVETISVNAEGQSIRRGIFRDFPLTMTDAGGREIEVDFKVVSVERDGQPEDWHSARIKGGERIYIGNADRILNPGSHIFRLTYDTNRQMRYFGDHDELYWNVTGNGWLFPILNAKATVTLPDGVQPQQLAFFTGQLGATDKNASASQQGNIVTFAMTRPLAAAEGLTIAIKLAKGAITPPSDSQQWGWFLRDHLDTIIAIGGLILLFAYYMRSWVVVGRDPPPGVMVPRWDPPEGISPALVNYIDNRGFASSGWTAFSATAIDLAVRGYVILDDLKGKVVIRPTGKAGSDLSGGDKVLMQAVGPFSPLVIDKANGEAVQQLGSKFRSAIERDHRDEYYKANSLYVITGIALSVLVLAAIVIFGRLHENTLPLIIVPGFLSIFVTIFASSIGRRFRRHSASLAQRIISVLIFAFFGFVFVSIAVSGFAAAVVPLWEAGLLPLVAAIVGIFALNVVFYFLMGAPTPLGRKMMDGIAGLRQYLTLAERDRMNMQGAPQMSPRHFEKLLPYAVALGVEKPWSSAFETWLATAAGATAAAAYAPVWYSGDFRPGNIGGTIGDFSSSMASTIASTIPAPVSSSSSAFGGGGGGGGGSSGGGGGGGGGGGW
ncbi:MULTISPECIES: DUF2207 domain-containing protein [Rhizobium]|uniref:Membrane protein YgcG n=2 Tax=Rhizobium tropici TaxID=398 RepID=A0ABR6QTB6_RHITR|nr:MULTISPECIES: DUF2207 domain-containing protein [Rhizobium]AGB70264.1 transmembrane signal peptide protein [Rhizobium tropici CIAT 899]MBB4239337.1 putative membrane protein YgcG [Rhizobium tropici]MBB5590607.1 putative membrane protein YgcG [Rhizobium tropici]MBB6490184.1 putative membrane protein YgcG [Rhizobium tropici]TGE99829.1 DUF2207 domain-containing protein [Rhizobium sp. SEMIA 4088]